MKNSLPKSLQPILWSVKIEDLNLEKDKIYIIHQILAFGNLKELKWLFNNYLLKEIKEIFLKHSIRIYRPQAFNFIKKIFLMIPSAKIDKSKYVATPLQSIR